MKKLIKISLENTTNSRQVDETFCEFYSHDRNNGLFEFEITNATLTTEKVTALFKFTRSKSYWTTDGAVEGSKVKVKFDTSLITQNEVVECHLYLDNTDEDADVFSFKFNVKVSELDKAKNKPIKERYFANSMIVDVNNVLTREVLNEEIKTLKETFVNNETLPKLVEDELNKKNFLTEHQDISNLATRDAVDEVSKKVTKLEERPSYDDSDVKRRITALEGANFLTEHQDITNLATKKSVEDVEAKVTQLEARPSYDDSEIKRKLKELEDRPVTANVDTSNFVTNAQLEEKHYLTAHQDISGLATKEQLDELKKSQPTVDNLVTKEQLRKAFLNEEGQEKYVDLDTFVSATRGVLGSSTNEKGVEEYFNEVTTGLSEEAKETYIGDIYKNATETKVYRKNGFTNFKDMMYALAKVFPDNYNYKDENQRVDILTNRNYQEYIKSSGNVDTSNFATKQELQEVSFRMTPLELQIRRKVEDAEAPFTVTGGLSPYQYFITNHTGAQYRSYGKIYSNVNERIIISGNGKYTNLDTALYTLASSIPDGYTPDFEFSESDNLKFITTQNIHNYIPTNTGNTGNTTELDNRLKVLESKQWEIHGRGMPNGVVTAPVGTTYVDEAVTNGALKWIKKSGTGNTGWEVLIGDTGWKIIPSVSKLGNSFVKIRRVNNVVSYQFGGLSWGWFGIVRRGGAGYVLQGSDRERNCYIIQNGGIPIGYRAEASLIGNIYNDKGVSYGTWYLGGNGDYNQLRFQFTDPVPTDRDIGDIRISSISYLTNEPWPQN